MALRERDTARLLYENSRQLAEAFLFEMDDRLQKEGAIGARRLLVERAKETLERLTSAGIQDPEIGRDLVAAYLKLGDVMGRLGGANLGRSGEARRSYERALEISRELTVRYPENEFVREQNAEALLRVAGITKTQGRPEAALALGQEAIRALEGEAGTRMTVARLRLLAAAYHDVGGTYSQMGKWQEVIAVREKALATSTQILASAEATLDDRLREILARTRLGSVLSREQKYDAAARELRRAVEDARRVHRENPQLSQASDTLSNALMVAGTSEAAQARFENAAGLYAQAYQLREALRARDPKDWRMRSLAATSALRWGLAEVKQGERRAGWKRIRRAVKERVELAAADPDNVGAQAEAGEGWAELAMALEAGNERREARERALKILEPLAREGKVNQILLEVLERLKGDRP